VIAVLIRGLSASALFIFAAAALGAPSPSAHADELAFVADHRGTRQIFLIRANGSGARRLTLLPGHHEGPIWSPDGRQLAYVRTDERGMQVHVMRANGSQTKRLTGPPGRHHAPAWSPDGRRIAYVEDRDGTSQIFVMRTDGSEKQRLTGAPRSNEAPSWSPDGTRIAYLSRLRGRQPELYVMGADGRDQHVVPTRTTGTIPVVSSVHWLRDGTTLVYTSRAGLAADEIAFVQSDGSGYRWFSTGYAPSVSPNGALVAYVVSRVGSAQVYLKPVAAGQSRPLTPRMWISVRPAWSPDGQSIAYLAVKPGEELAVWIMNADGSGHRRLAPAAGNFSILPVISWRPR
jgi:Tol biopolymer transport system component